MCPFLQYTKEVFIGKNIPIGQMTKLTVSILSLTNFEFKALVFPRLEAREAPSSTLIFLFHGMIS